MVLIIGGAYQGKAEYASENYSDKEIVDNFQDIVKNQLDNGENPQEQFLLKLDEYKNVVIICEDISCGIVPVDAAQRTFREELGRTLALVSKHSTEVIRMFCGIGTKIK